VYRFQSEIQHLLGLETIPSGPMNYEHFVSFYMFDLFKQMQQSGDFADHTDTKLLTRNFKYGFFRLDRFLD